MGRREVLSTLGPIPAPGGFVCLPACLPAYPLGLPCALQSNNSRRSRLRAEPSEEEGEARPLPPPLRCSLRLPLAQAHSRTRRAEVAAAPATAVAQPAREGGQSLEQRRRSSSMAGPRYPQQGSNCRRATTAMNLLLGVFQVLLPCFRPGEAQVQGGTTGGFCTGMEEGEGSRERLARGGPRLLPAFQAVASKCRSLPSGLPLCAALVLLPPDWFPFQSAPGPPEWPFLPPCWGLATLLFTRPVLNCTWFNVRHVKVTDRRRDGRTQGGLPPSPGWKEHAARASGGGGCCWRFRLASPSPFSRGGRRLKPAQFRA